MSVFPEIFAMLRTQSSRGPFWQIFRRRVSNQFYEVESDQSYTSAVNNFQENTHPFLVQEARFKLSHNEISVIKFWFLPIQLNVFGLHIPVLDFEYKSWLPRPLHRIPVSNIDQLKDLYKNAYNSFQTNTSLQIRSSEFASLPFRPPTPPLQRRASTSDSESITSTESVLSIYQNESVFLVQHHDDFQYKEKPLHLPETVGALLLKQAWDGEGCCPILTVPFKEIASLSVTSCFHIFDAESLRQWKLTKNDCPVCRCLITNVVTLVKN